MWDRKANICPILALAVVRPKEGRGNGRRGDGGKGRWWRIIKRTTYFSFVGAIWCLAVPILPSLRIMGGSQPSSWHKYASYRGTKEIRG